MTKASAEIVWIAGLLAWCLIRFPFARGSRKTAVARSMRDTQEQMLLGLAGLGLFVIPAVYALTGFPAAFDYRFVPALGWLGAAVLVVSLWLFYLSHAALGANFSSTLKVRQSHTLVQSGLYGCVRHPMYSSFFLLGLAQGLLFPNVVAALAGIAGTAILFALRVGREERMMLELFPSEYPAYMARTKRIIPWLY